jgi:hypothetical protein
VHVLVDELLLLGEQLHPTLLASFLLYPFFLPQTDLGLSTVGWFPDDLFRIYGLGGAHFDGGRHAKAVGKILQIEVKH